jgi:hypothetical protein
MRSKRRIGPAAGKAILNSCLSSKRKTPHLEET